MRQITHNIGCPYPCHAPVLHTAFYKFVHLDDPAGFAERLKQAAGSLLGTVLLATEGINATLAGDSADVETFETWLRSDSRFADVVFKHSRCRTPPFARLKVHCKREIVALGIDGVEAVGKPGQQLSAAAWRELLDRDDVVVLDNRNAFEYRLGHFRGAVNPDVALFSDFPRYIQEQWPRWQAEGKTIAMYCTGGIRCEKTSAWLEDQGIPCLQLDGGILRFLADMPNAERDFIGDCFVFDNRLALTPALEEAAVSAETVYAEASDGLWRIERARRLRAAVAESEEPGPQSG